MELNDPMRIAWSPIFFTLFFPFFDSIIDCTERLKLLEKESVMLWMYHDQMVHFYSLEE